MYEYIYLTPTRRWTDAHFGQFLIVLEFSPIGKKISADHRTTHPVHCIEKK